MEVQMTKSQWQINVKLQALKFKLRIKSLKFRFWHFLIHLAFSRLPDRQGV
jgi:hypothetical protein